MVTDKQAIEMLILFFSEHIFVRHHRANGPGSITTTTKREQLRSQVPWRYLENADTRIHVWKCWLFSPSRRNCSSYGVPAYASPSNTYFLVQLSGKQVGLW